MRVFNYLQVSNYLRTASGALALFALLHGAAGYAQHAPHAQHAGAHATPTQKVELGTGWAVDGQGRLWAASKQTEGTNQFVVLQMSADQGQSWTAPRRVQTVPEPVAADGENRPKLAFGPKGELYLSYTKPLAKPYTGDIRFVRSLDGGQTFSPPITVHANRDVITHRFDALIVDRSGRVFVAWIDKRDLHAAEANKDASKEAYRGAAVYYAVSQDRGASFGGDHKIADHSCECCRIALALNPAGVPVALWRQVFAPNIRDHALAMLPADGKVGQLQRATFDNWAIDACPHHGPSLAFAADGTRHQTWFSGGEQGGAFYAQAAPNAALSTPLRLGSAQAAHPDVVVAGKLVAVAWKEFDGKATVALAKLSLDGGQSWREQELGRTTGASDVPTLLNTPKGIVLAWRTAAEGLRVMPLRNAFVEEK